MFTVVMKVPKLLSIEVDVRRRLECYTCSISLQAWILKKACESINKNLFFVFSSCAGFFFKLLKTLNIIIIIFKIEISIDILHFNVISKEYINKIFDKKHLCIH